MKQLFTIIVVLFTVATSYAQSITGRVVDENSKPVVGAVVALLQLPDSSLVTTALADVDGKFTIKAKGDMVDFFSTYIRRTSYDGYSSTPMKMDIQYTIIDKAIFTSSISYTVNWQMLKANSYKAVMNARPKPDQTKLVQFEVIDFSDFKPDANKAFKSMLQATTMGSSMTYYYAPYVSDKWKGVGFKGVDMVKVAKDLTLGDNRFEKQVADNGTKLFYIDINTGKPIKYLEPFVNLTLQESAKKMTAEYQKATLKLYPAIFKVAF